MALLCLPEDCSELTADDEALAEQLLLAAETLAKCVLTRVVDCCEGGAAMLAEAEVAWDPLSTADPLTCIYVWPDKDVRFDLRLDRLLPSFPVLKLVELSTDPDSDKLLLRGRRLHIIGEYRYMDPEDRQQPPVPCRLVVFFQCMTAKLRRLDPDYDPQDMYATGRLPEDEEASQRLTLLQFPTFGATNADPQRS